MNADAAYTLDQVLDAIQRDDAEYINKAIEAGFDPNTQDSKQRTPLILAAQFQKPAMVKLLLTLGADANHKESHGYDAAQVATWYGEYRMGAYTKESKEIEAILQAHKESQEP